jgi:hypothetical protein
MGRRVLCVTGDGTVPGMRHLGSLIAGIVAAPLCWLLLAFGQVSSAKAFANGANNGTLHTNDFIRPLIYLAVAGIIIGLVATLRTSPVGPLVAGVMYAGSYVALLIAPERVLHTFSYTITISHERADLTQPLTTGTALVIGAALLVAVFSVGRWRRWPRPEQAAADSEPAEEKTTSWNAFSNALDVTTDSATTADLQTTSGTAWTEQGGRAEKATETVPAKGRTPWETPLRDTGGKH